MITVLKSNDDGIATDIRFEWKKDWEVELYYYRWRWLNPLDLALFERRQLY